eukprot:scaffold132395_cov15-Prasinocladus_malaysianus.AAC.2
MTTTADMRHCEDCFHFIGVVGLRRMRQPSGHSEALSPTEACKNGWTGRRLSLTAACPVTRSDLSCLPRPCPDIFALSNWGDLPICCPSRSFPRPVIIVKASATDGGNFPQVFLLDSLSLDCP